MRSADYLKEVIDIARLIPAEQIEALVGELKALRDRGGRLFLVGLGGSAANCSHAVSDFRRLCGIEAYTPVDNIAELTAAANDEGWPYMFPLSFRNPRDALMVLSVGGGKADVSKPLVWAVQIAKRTNMKILWIVGRDGGYTADKGDCVIIVPTVNHKHVTHHTK